MLEFACVSVIFNEMSDQTFGREPANWHASHLYFTEHSCFFSFESSSVFQMRNWKLKEVKRLSDGHRNRANQGFLVKPMVFDLFREINPKFRGGVIRCSLSDSFTY